MTVLLDPVQTGSAESGPSLVLYHELGQGRFDGLWCPASWDIGEVAALVVALSAQIGVVGRITLHPGSWQRRPRLLELSDRQLRIDWLAATARDEVSVRRGYAPRLIIQLRPPPASATVLAVTPTPTTVYR